MTKNELLDGGLERVSQAAKRLGMDRRTLYHWIQEGKVTYTYINGVYRIPSRAVDEMLVAGLKIDPALTVTKRNAPGPSFGLGHRQTQLGDERPVLMTNN